jgi:hypothetical protein
VEDCRVPHCVYRAQREARPFTGFRWPFAGCFAAAFWCIAAGVAHAQVAPIPAVPAQTGVLPYGAVDYEHNSNLFYLPSYFPAPIGKNGPSFSDQSLNVRGGLTAAYDWGQQVFHAIVEVRRFEYDNFNYLDHYENLVDVGWDWKLGSVVSGELDYRHEKRMVQFQELIDSESLFMETENIANASANVLVTPEWLWENVGKDRVLDSPRPEALNLSLHEDSILEGVRYLGVSNLSAGFELTYLTGHFSNDQIYLEPAYHQWTAGLAADYAVSRLSSFNGTFGYTRRSDSLGDDLSGITGSLGYKRNLSGKTTFSAKLTRAVNSYVSTEGSEVDTSAVLTLNYQLTYKTSFNAGYSWTESKFPNYAVVNIDPITGLPITGVGANGNTVEDRVDHIQYATVEANYQALHWLSLRAYGRYQTRHSNEELNTYDVTIYGIEFLAKLPQ